MENLEKYIDPQTSQNSKQKSGEVLGSKKKTLLGAKPQVSSDNFDKNSFIDSYNYNAGIDMLYNNEPMSERQKIRMNELTVKLGRNPEEDVKNYTPRS